MLLLMAFHSRMVIESAIAKGEWVCVHNMRKRSRSRLHDIDSPFHRHTKNNISYHSLTSLPIDTYQMKYNFSEIIIIPKFQQKCWPRQVCIPSEFSASALFPLSLSARIWYTFVFQVQILSWFHFYQKWITMSRIKRKKIEGRK